MKEIGDIFKEKRKEIGITIKEASLDLGIDEILIENLEDGNDKAFKDILELKDIIRKYAKYLDLDFKNFVDMYNDYLFEKTSKISLSDVRERLVKEKNKSVEKKIHSPYTYNVSKGNSSKDFIVLIIILILISVSLYFLLNILIIG